MALALMVKNSEEVVKLFTEIDKDTENKNTITLTVSQLKDKDSKKENDFKAVRPFTIFYNFDEETGSIKFIQYVTDPETNSTTIGFSNTIDVGYINLEECLTDETGLVKKDVNVDEFIKLCIKSNNDHIREFMGDEFVNILKSADAFKNYEIINISEDDDCVSVVYLIHIGSEYFDEAVMNNKLKKLNHLYIGALGVFLNGAIEQGDVSAVMEKIGNDVSGTSIIDEISLNTFKHVIYRKIKNFTKYLTYSDMLKIVKQKRAIETVMSDPDSVKNIKELAEYIENGNTEVKEKKQ